MKLVVVGAGVVGCASAYAATLAGHAVTLVDAAAAPGQGASFANGGQLSWSHVEPLATPGVLQHLPGALWPRAAAGLQWRWRADPAQWLWGLRFLHACTAARAEHGTLALLALAQASRFTLGRWLQAEPLDFGYRRVGKLVLCADEGALTRQRRRVALQAAAGQQLQLLTSAECIAREPLLERHPGFVGGVWSSDDAVADARQLCHALCAAVERRGGRIVLGAAASGFALRHGRAQALLTAQGAIDGDAFVLAAGHRSTALARSLGERLPIYPLRGYSLTLPATPGQALPGCSITDLAAKLLVAPLGGRLRVAAWIDIGGDDTRFARRRRQALARAVERLLPGVCDWRGDWQPWAGLRPATPTSLPIVRRSRVANVVLNVGHGALGFTLAAGSAARMVELLGEGPAPA